MYRPTLAEGRITERRSIDTNPAILEERWRRDTLFFGIRVFFRVFGGSHSRIISRNLLLTIFRTPSSIYGTNSF